MLKAVETATVRDMKGEELATFIRKRHHNLHSNSAQRAPLFDERRRDEASHYILRLAFCGAVPNDNLGLLDAETLSSAENGRRWFVNQEVALLRYRFEVLAEIGKERDEFIKYAIGLIAKKSPETIRIVSPAELDVILDQLRILYPNADRHSSFYNVPWELVPDMVAKRSVLMYRGRAYVPYEKCVSIIYNFYKEELERSLEAIAREIPFLRDDRIVPLLEALRRCDYSLDASMASSSSGLVDQLTAGDIDKASVHFPLCMQHLHRNLRADRHLKFNGRQQYGLFLKSIGLSLSEALIFWRTAFLPKYSVEQFNKDYAYNVRHNYGQEGKRANYTSYSCGKICSGSAASGEYHGCPFKHAGSAERLTNILSLYTGPNGVKLSEPQIKEVVDLAVKESHYQVACTRVFEYTRPVKPRPEVVTHPHLFYEASVNICAPKKESK